MKVDIQHWELEKYGGCRAYWWEGYKNKDLSTCIIEIDSGKSLYHQHLNPNEHETEIILDGEAFYEGEINKSFKKGDVIDQRGKSEPIKITNKGNEILRILVVNRPPWSYSDEKILSIV